MKKLSSLLLTVVVAVVAIAACDSRENKDGASATSQPTVSTAKKTASPAPRLAAALNVAALDKALSCKSKRATGACKVLAGFRNCVKWNPITQSGDGRWLGEGYDTQKKGKPLKQFTLLRTKRVALTDVATGQLPVTVGIGSLSGDPNIERHAKKAIAKYRRNDVPKKFNLAISYIKNRSDWPKAYARQAEQNQIFVTADGGTFLCALRDQRVLLIQRSNDSENAAAGVYATLWAVTW